MMAASKRMRRKFIRSTSPCCAQRTSELLIGSFARPGERIDLSTLMNSDLRDNVGRASEAVYPKVSGLLDRTGHHQRTVTNQARAQKGSRLHVAVRLVQRKTKGCLGHCEFSVTAVDRVTGEPGMVTEVFPICLGNTGTMTAGPTEPGNPDARPHSEMLNLGAAFHNFSDNFMPRNERKFWVRQFAVHDMEVGPANSAGQYPHEHLPCARRRSDHLAFAKGSPRFFKNHRAHNTTISTSGNGDPRKISRMEEDACLAASEGYAPAFVTGRTVGEASLFALRQKRIP